MIASHMHDNNCALHQFSMDFKVICFWYFSCVWGENITTTITDVLDNWNLSFSQLIATTTDNGSAAFHSLDTPNTYQLLWSQSLFWLKACCCSSIQEIISKFDFQWVTKSLIILCAGRPSTCCFSLRSRVFFQTTQLTIGTDPKYVVYAYYLNLSWLLTCRRS